VVRRGGRRRGGGGGGWRELEAAHVHGYLLLLLLKCWWLLEVGVESGVKLLGCLELEELECCVEGVVFWEVVFIGMPAMRYAETTW